MPRRLRVSTSKLSVLTVTREAISNPKTSYVLTANKSLRYPEEKSTIVYLGTTERGLKRITETIAARADKIFAEYGINEVEVHVIKCQGQRRVRSWEHLEHALLLCFKRYYGDVPIANKVGRGSINKWQRDLAGC